MAAIFLDTHVVCWLYAGKSELLSKKAAGLIETHQLLVSPIVELELQLLYEIKRLKIQSSKILATLETDIDLVVVDDSYGKIVRSALGSQWTRDPFDRLIVAHSALRKSKLLTRDRAIHEHFDGAAW